MKTFEVPVYIGIEAENAFEADLLVHKLLSELQTNKEFSLRMNPTVKLEVLETQTV